MPGSTYSTNLKVELMATGENSGTWGDITNTNLGTALEQAIVGYGNPNYSSDANLTISITNSNAAQAARALVLNVTSSVSLTATRELVVPTIQKQYIVQNNTTGSQSITVKTSAGTGITVPNGRKAHLYVDGTNVIQMFDFVDINGGAIDGTPIGASSASTGAFTTLNASGATTLDGNVTLGNASSDNVTVTGTITSNLLFTDNTYDIGASGATRPRNLFLAGAATIGGNLSVGGTLTLTGGVNLNGNVTVGDNASDTLTINSTITSNLIFTDNTYDIGASGATRPRNLFLAGNATIGGNQTLTGSLTVDSTTDSSSAVTGSIQTDGGLGVAKSLYVGATGTVQSVLTVGAAATTDAVALFDSLNVNGSHIRLLNANTANTYFGAAAGISSSGTASDTALRAQGALYLLTNGNNPRVTVNNDGYVGIRTTAPVGFLHVAPGNAASSGAGAPIILQAQQGGASSAGGNILLGSGQNGSGGSNGYIAFGIGSATSGSAFSSGERMRLTNNGNLVIGATTDVFNGQGLPLVVGTGSGNQGLTIYSGSTGYGTIQFADTASTGADSYRGVVSYKHGDEFMYFSTDATERVRISSDGTFRVKGAGTAGSTDAVQFAGSAPASSLALNSSGNLLLGTTSASGAKMDLAFSTTQNGLVVAPTTYVYPTYSLISTNGVIGTVKSASGTVRLLDIRAQEQTALANGQVIGGYFQIDNPNAAVNVNGGNIGLYGVVNGVNNFTTGHQYGVLGRSGSGGTWGVGVMAQLGGEQSLGLRAALVAQTDNTTDPIALFRNSGGEVGRFTGNGNFGVGATPSTWLWPDGSTGVLQLQAGAAFSGYNAGAVVSQNWYYNAGEKFIANGYASRYSQTTGLHIWSTSTASNAGGAGAALTWAEVARMDNDKNLLIGTTSSAGRLAVVGGATATGYNLYLGQGGSYQDTAGYGNSDYGNGTWNWVPGTVPGSGTAQFWTRFRSRSGGGYATVHNVMIDGGVLVADTTTAYSAQLYVNGAIAARNGGVDATFQNAFVAGYTSNYTEKNIIQTAVSSAANGSGFRFQVSNGAGSSGVTTAMDVIRSGINFYSGGSIVANIQSGGFFLSGANYIYWDKSGTRSWQMFCNQTSSNLIIQSGDSLGTINLVSSTVAVSGSLSKGSGSFRIEHPLPELAPTHQLVHSFIEGPQADLIYRGKANLVNGTATINIDQAAGMTEGTFVVLCRDVQCFTTNESDWTAVRGSVSGNILTIEAQDNTSTASISWMVIAERQDKHMYDTNWTDDNGKVIVEPLKPQ